MSQASRRADAADRDRDARWQRWTGALLTALVHLLLVLLVLLAPPITMTPPPEGGDAGSRMDVTFIDETLRPPSPTQVPSPRVTPPRRAKTAPRAAKRLRTTLVEHADASVATERADPTDTPTTVPAADPAQPPSEPPASPPAPDDTAQPPHVWGQPPGMQPQDHAPVNAGMAANAGIARGRRNDASSGTSMEVGGYQVYYDLVSENRLRAWRDQGMTELFLPLPGTRRLMVCPLEIALRRDSGACRLVEPDSPELKTIGDARDVINMQKVYKLGEELWSGPGAYR